MLNEEQQQQQQQQHDDDGDDDDGKNYYHYQLKQVELNTIASSFAGLSCKIAGLHRYLTSRFAAETNEFLESNIAKVSSSSSSSSSSTETLSTGVPQNPALEELPLG